MSIKDQKEESLLTELAAKYIAREAGRSTLITPLRADMSDRKHVTIFVSVFPAEESDNAIKFLARHKGLFREYLKKASRLSILPYITFEIDYGEINRQRIHELSKEIGFIAPEESDPAV